MAVKAQTLLSAAVSQGLVAADTLAELAVRARRERVALQDLVCFSQRLAPASLYHALAQSRQLPYITTTVVDEAAMRRLPPALLARQGLATVQHAGVLHLLVVDPDDHAGIETARRLVGGPLPLALGDPEAIAALVSAWQRQQAGVAANAVSGSASSDHVAMLDELLRRAYMNRASDIHIQPEEGGYGIRYRVDGRLQDAPRRLSPPEGAGLLSRLKVLAGLDIAESRDAQDGSLTYLIGGLIPTDIRVATLPTRHGERATLRLLGSNSEALTLTRLGMDEALLEGFRQGITRPHGIILVTGPTGSGKSSTLYAALGELMTPEINVLTVEDPIERVLAGASQVQVSSKLGFADTLRSFLRHDPDVVMVGEIRDLDTAEVALKAAMTGHLVFSTLHTNSAASAVARLADLGVPRFLIAATLVGVLAQRLVRCLCPQCRQPRPANAQEIRLLGLTQPHPELFEATGCPACTGTGYRGRIGLFEALWMSEAALDQVAGGAGEAELIAASPGFHSLWDDGRNKVLAGQTTLSEVLRVAQPRKD